jgi:tetratricopeptide (TPR) repeat protein
MSFRCVAAALTSIIFLLLATSLCHSENDVATVRDRTILDIQQLIERGDLASARHSLNEAAIQFPNDAGLDNLLGVIEAQQGHYVLAETSFRKAIQRDPRFTSAYLNLGRLYQENLSADPHARDKALETYERLLSFDSDNAEANYQSATLLLANGKYRESLARLASLPKSTQEEAQALSILFDDYAGIGDRKQTDDVATRLLRSPDFSEADARQILPALRIGKRGDLIVAFLENLQKQGQLSPDLLHSLGLAYESLGRPSEARATLEQLANDHLSVVLLLELARIAHEQKDYTGSLGYLAHARDLDPKNANIHYSFGLVCLDMDLIAEARNSFEKAVTLEPDNPSYNYEMGATSAFRHDASEAVPYFEKYIKLKPDDPRGKLALGAALFKAKDYDNAGTWLVDAAKSPATATAAHYYLGVLALQEGSLDEASTQLNLALQQKADYPDALAELGHYYLIKKDYVESEKKLQRALAIEPDHLSANFYLLTLYTRTGDPRRSGQSKRYEDLQKLLEEKSREFLRMVEVRPFEDP